MHMDEIQYTYKPCKMKSIHEIERCILETQTKTVKLKTNTI